MALPIFKDPEINEETELCLSCLAPQEVSAHFCAKCGAPLSSYASTGPIERAFASGFVFRQSADRPRKLVVLFGIWLIFAPLGLVSLLMLFPASSGFTPISLLGLLVLILSAAIIWKTTRNYFRQKPPLESAPE